MARTIPKKPITDRLSEERLKKDQAFVNKVIWSEAMTQRTGNGYFSRWAGIIPPMVETKQ